MIDSWICRDCNEPLIIYREEMPGELLPEFEAAVRNQAEAAGGLLVDLRTDPAQCPKCGTTRGFDRETAGEQGVACLTQTFLKECECGYPALLFVPAISGPLLFARSRARELAADAGAVLVDITAPVPPMCPLCGRQFFYGEGRPEAADRERIGDV